MSKGAKEQKPGTRAGAPEPHIPGNSPCHARQHSASCAAFMCALVEEGWFLKRPANNSLGIELEPVFQDGGVDPTEVLIGHQITLRQMFRLQRRILAVLPALDGITNGKGNATSAVVGA